MHERCHVLRCHVFAANFMSSLHSFPAKMVLMPFWLWWLPGYSGHYGHQRSDCCHSAESDACCLFEGADLYTIMHGISLRIGGTQFEALQGTKPSQARVNHRAIIQDRHGGKKKDKPGIFGLFLLFLFVLLLQYFFVTVFLLCLQSCCRSSTACLP